MSVPELVSLVITIMGGVFWLARLEGRVTRNAEMIEMTEDDVKLLQVKYEALDSKIFDEISKLRVAVARIEVLIVQNKTD